jgi:anti-anti-sigma factor
MRIGYPASVGEGSALDIAPAGTPGSFIVRGEIDLHTAHLIAEIPVPATGPGSNLTLDVSGVSFIDSIGVWALVNLSRGLATGGRLIIKDPSEPVRRTLEVADLGGAPEIMIDRS